LQEATAKSKKKTTGMVSDAEYIPLDAGQNTVVAPASNRTRTLSALRALYHILILTI